MTRYGIPFLLAASLFFYGYWNPYYLLLIFFSILSTYLSALALQQFEKDLRFRKLILLSAILINFAILIVFKYYNFFAKELSQFQSLIHFPFLDILLPVGISFYTFQAIGYLIDVYRNEISAERDFFTYSLFVTFFPQLVAGPIEKSTHLLPQFKERENVSKEDFLSGLDLILWGLLKKVVIADRAAVYVNSVYNEPQTQEPLTLLVGSILFSVQIYCDFSGYSDIAVGTARSFGFKLIQNFNRPYFATSIIEFWNRWHISLTKWFREYLYIPLGGNRVSSVRGMLNILIVFSLSGFWHGANWTYLVWGLLHGFFLLSNRVLRKFHFFSFFSEKRWLNAFLRFQKMLLTFCLVSLAWIFFRADSLHNAVLILKRIFFEMKVDLSSIQSSVLPFTHSNTSIAYALILFLWICIVFYIEKKEKIEFHLTTRFLILGSILIFGNFNSSSFLYFQF
jgi:D-alanyl-lipoteichoic acid acyltransferase DltB (MBOAT superfamily)